MSLATTLLRSMWSQNDRKRDKDCKEPDNLTIYRNISYAPSESDREQVFHLTDIYRPSISSSLCLLMDFLRQKETHYGIDPGHLFMVGDSVGAQLVSQYCILTTNPEYQNLFKKAVPNIPDLSILSIPRAVGLNCGIYDVREIKKQKFAQWYLPKQMEAPLANSFWNVLDYMTGDFPPAYLMTSVNDSLKIHTAVMKTKLEELNIPFRYKEYGEGCPQDDHVFHINLKSQNGLLCNAEECSYFAAM